MNAPEQQFEETSISLAEVFTVLKKNAVAIVACGICAAILGFLITFLFISPIYEASAKMIVNTHTDQNTTVTNDQLNSAKSLVDIYAIIIRSHTVLEPVIENLKLEESVADLQDKISVQSANNTQVMQITVKDNDAEQAKAIVTQILAVAPDIIMNTVEAGSVKTIEQPVVSDGPIAPSKSKNAMIAGLAGLLLATGFFFLRFMLDNTFKSELDIQKELDLPVLGLIPTIESCMSAPAKSKGGFSK